MRALGIIPARGGSDGVKGKNLRKVAGEPLIAYAIRAGQCSSLSELVLITDSGQAAEIAMFQHCSTYSLVKTLADGPVVDACRYAFHHAETIHPGFDVAVLLQPDSPIRLPTDIDACLKMLDDNPDTDGVISVYKVEDAHPAHMYELHDGKLSNSWSSYSAWEVGSRQEKPTIYHRNGAIYAVRRETLMIEGWIPKRKLGYVMPRELSLTIDTEFDLLMAERQVQLWKEGKLTKPASSGLTLSPSRQNPSPAWMG